MDNKIDGWEYKKIESRKKGTTLIFGKLDELLKKYYHVTTLDALDKFRSNYKEQYIINCPFCKQAGHTKRKLHIYPNSPGKDDFTEGFCFVCGRIFFHISDEININFRSPDFLGLEEGFKFIPIEDNFWTLEKFNDEFDFDSQRGVNYLVKRNPFLKDLWKPLGFKFYGDHVAMPFRDPDGRFIYYQIRFIDADKYSGIRFHFPKISAKPPYILHSSEANPSHLIICEGIFDCIAAWIQCGGRYVCIALLGCKVSDYQLSFIRHWYRPRKIIFWLDETELSIDVSKRFRTIFNYSNSKIIPSHGSDPEEILNHRLRFGRDPVWISPEYGETGKVSFPKFKLNLK